MSPDETLRNYFCGNIMKLVDEISVFFFQKMSVALECKRINNHFPSLSSLRWIIQALLM